MASAVLGEPPRSWLIAATVAIAFPPLIAFNVPPSATFFNQAAAFAGWGAFLLCVAASLPASAWPRGRGVRWMLGCLAILAISAAVAPEWSALPLSLALSALAVIAAAALVIVIASAAAEAGHAEPAFHAFCIGLLVAGALSALIGLVQVYAPGWSDGDWIARTPSVGRAVGNMRQPNHLSSLLLWSIVAAVWLRERGRLSRGVALALAAGLLYVVVLSGSRTGALGSLTLAAWGALDTRLSKTSRRSLLLAPLAYGAMWLLATEIAHVTHAVFGGESRFSPHGDISSSRFAIWSNTLALIAAHPWAGVGFGDFNFAWSLTPFPDRPVAFFDHTHNLALQLLVELGLPLGLAALGALVVALVYAVRQAIAARDASSQITRAALVVVLMVMVHSQLEYPLWYTYFLFPTCFALGLCLGRPVAAPAASSDARPHPTRPLVLASMLLPLIAVVALWDYTRVVVIFTPPADAGPLEKRIEAGRRSWFFAPHADYAAATTAPHPAAVIASFGVATHYLLDTRLMMAWARALHELGDDERAHYIAQRLREFRNEASVPFFAPCDDASTPEAGKPFQCKAPTRAFSYLDFR